ncbi:hypothetical protein BDK92_2989 [Micromonospora pisi]|uniref:Uncharacterized protein n=1 Tax=Micromonospora pisi TaxID=589240 RepID=A0A495JHY4_9ACTN|nr:hypothetical protein [Micromonospora pisi]RKR88660.1 hypothetical protein BDK92_2989 [Micromonospora pisi]
MNTDDGHVWHTRSRHRTSDGVVTYQSCHCGLWRLLSAAELATVGAARTGGRPVRPVAYSSASGCVDRR